MIYYEEAYYVPMLETNCMLTIRSQQITTFEQAALRKFEDEMVVHSRDFSPKLCEVLGEEQLRVALRQAMARADGYGFTYRGPIRLFIEMMFLFGSKFDTDPQYPWAAKILLSDEHQMQRAEQLFEKIIYYQEKVSGPGGENTRRALRDLLAWTKNPITFSSSNFEAGMRQEMSHVFPEKAAFIADEGLTTLINEGMTEGMKYQFSPVRGEALIVTLLFAFGHGCTDDPLYPWIAQTLKDERIIDPAARAARLEKKAVTWLEHVLAAPRAGAQR